MTQQLFDAIRYNCLKKVKYLVSLGANIRCENDYAVRVASMNGHLEIVEYILFCQKMEEKMEEKKKERAQKKIYYWVQEYVLSRPEVVDRMAERSYLLSQKGEMI